MAEEKKPDDKKAVAKRPIDTVRELLESARPAIQSVIPSYLSIDRLLQVALVAASREPKLLQCTSSSLLQSVMQAAELGLEAGGPLGHAYLIPYENHGVTECQLIVGFKGYVDLARENKQTIQSEVVHANDEFDYDLGTNRFVHFKKAMTGDRGPVLCAYAICTETGMDPVIEVMRLDDLEAIRKRSKAKSDKSPWNTDTEQMYRKCPVRRIQKYIQLSLRQRKALEYDQEAEDIDLGSLKDVTPLMTPQAVKTTSTPKAAEEPKALENKPAPTVADVLVASETKQPEPIPATTGGAGQGPAEPTEATPWDPERGEVDPIASAQAAEEICQKIAKAPDEAALAPLTTYFVKNNHLFTLAALTRMREAATARLAEIKGKK